MVTISAIISSSMHILVLLVFACNKIIFCRDKSNTIIYTCIVLLQVSRLPILLSGSRFNALTETGITKTIILVLNPLNTDWLFNLVLYNKLDMCHCICRGVELELSYYH